MCDTYIVRHADAMRSGLLISESCHWQVFISCLIKVGVKLFRWSNKVGVYLLPVVSIRPS
jgi:hypothetical protein